MPTSDYTPSLEQVAAYVRERTLNGYGTEVGTFSDQVGADERTMTKPTAEQALTLVKKATREVSVAVGADLPAKPEGWDPANPDAVEWPIRDSATELAALYAAMLVELNYYGRQINSGGSTYPQLNDLYKLQRKALIEDVAETRGGGGGESAAGSDTGAPSYDFPDPEPLWDRRF